MEVTTGLGKLITTSTAAIRRHRKFNFTPGIEVEHTSPKFTETFAPESTKPGPTDLGSLCFRKLETVHGVTRVTETIDLDNNNWFKITDRYEVNATCKQGNSKPYLSYKVKNRITHTINPVIAARRPHQDLYHQLATQLYFYYSFNRNLQLRPHLKYKPNCQCNRCERYRVIHRTVQSAINKLLLSTDRSRRFTKSQLLVNCSSTNCLCHLTSARYIKQRAKGLKRLQNTPWR